MVEESGPWRAVIDYVKRDINIKSGDFHHDVMLTINGNFKNLDQKLEYAQEIVRRLNKGNDIDG